MSKLENKAGIVKSLSEFGFIEVYGDTDPTTPEMSGKIVKVPGRDGLWNFGKEMNAKSVAIPLLCVENDPIVMQQRFDELNAFLFDEYGKPAVLKLMHDNWPDKYLMCEIAGQISPSRMYRVGSFTLNFIAYDPYKYSNVYSDEITWGSEVITFGSTYLLGHDNPSADMVITAPGSVSVTVIGQAVKPIIEITGSATDLVIIANGKSITVGTFADDVWVIECDKYISYQNGVEKILDMGNFILKSGDNTLSFTGSCIDMTVSVKFRDKWL